MSLNLLEELQPKKRKKKRKLSEKILDELQARPIAKGIEYDPEGDRKYAISIIQDNLDFANSEKVEIFNKISTRFSELKRLNNDENLNSKFQLISDWISDLGEKIKL